MARKGRLFPNIITWHPGQQTIAIEMLPKISRSKDT